MRRALAPCLAAVLALTLAPAARADQQPVNRGAAPGDKTAEPLFSAFGKLNANDADLYARAAALQAQIAAGVSRLPTRVATGTSAATVATDGIVVVRGPTVLTLETAPANGTTHVVKLGSGTTLAIQPGGADTIDGAASLTFTNAGQAAAFTYATGYGWLVY